MTAVTVLTAARINQRKVERRLVRAGYAMVPHGGDLQVSRHGRWDAVTTTVPRIADMPSDSVEAARRLLGFPPRTGVTCWFEGSVGHSDSWSTVVDIARAVAADVPLAVLDDHAGTSYLVHAVRGLIAPEEYEQVRGRATTADFLRRPSAAERRISYQMTLSPDTRLNREQPDHRRGGERGESRRHHQHGQHPVPAA